MIRYSVQSRDWIFVKGFGILPFAKNIGKNVAKIISKNLVGANIARNFLIMQNNLQQMHLKLLHKETIQKTV